ncbi:anti-sigma factor family protein [Streptantibioticus rubrisoli]|uniref:Zf-HC2 domain-containing protein n=1 Tax=Streptantibioticus rubrisoli TaxID=1387313 RepID=A0ABT1PHI9_9ACTN|nr:zf-HC2 domain-containing protein [Streptantibioticus rubrisoli]MCQ4044832.1 zf-HC2 domain-containing protein [Streptantibioticus rubrisoli]
MTEYAQPDPHTDVGAYLLGVLDDAEMDRFEQHLAECDICARRLDELGGVVPVLAELGGAGVPEPPGEAMLDRLLGEVAAQRRTRVRRRRLTAVAAAVLIVAGPTAAVLATQGEPVVSGVQAAAFQRTATDPVSGASATVGMTGRPWGTQIDLRLSYVYGPRTCHLVVVGKDGRQETIASWTVSGQGYGTDEHPQPLDLKGSTAMPPSAISHFDVVTSKGEKLVSVKA